MGEKRNKWIVGHYYREYKIIGEQGSETLEKQQSRFDVFIDTVNNLPSDKNILIMGDFNIDLEVKTNYPTQALFKDKLLDNLPIIGLTQTVNKTTRHSSNSRSTLIDHSWNNNMNKHITTNNIDSTSDHDLIMTKLKIKGDVSTKEATYGRNFNKHTS